MVWDCRQLAIGEVWLAHIQEADKQTHTCKVHFFVEIHTGSGVHAREHQGRRSAEVIYWDSILSPAGGMAGTGSYPDYCVVKNMVNKIPFQDTVHTEHNVNANTVGRDRFPPLGGCVFMFPTVGRRGNTARRERVLAS